MIMRKVHCGRVRCTWIKGRSRMWRTTNYLSAQPANLTTSISMDAWGLDCRDKVAGVAEFQGRMAHCPAAACQPSQIQPSSHVAGQLYLSASHMGVHGCGFCQGQHQRLSRLAICFEVGRLIFKSYLSRHARTHYSSLLTQ